MDSSLVRGSVWIVAALVAVLAIGWAGTGGCAGGNAQLRADIDDLASRVQTLEGRVRKLEGGTKATRAGKAKGKGKAARLAKAKAKGAGGAGAKAKADGAKFAKSPGGAKAKVKAAPQPAEGAVEGEIPPG